MTRRSAGGASSLSPHHAFDDASRFPASSRAAAWNDVSSTSFGVDSTRYSVRGSNTGPVLLQSELGNEVGLVEEVLLNQRHELVVPGPTQLRCGERVSHEEGVANQMVAVESLE